MHLVPPGKLTEGVSPRRAFPWILNNEIFGSPAKALAGLGQDESQRGFSLEALAHAPSPLTPKLPSVLGPRAAEEATGKRLVCTEVGAHQRPPPGRLHLVVVQACRAGWRSRARPGTSQRPYVPSGLELPQEPPGGALENVAGEGGCLERPSLAQCHTNPIPDKKG